MEPFNAALLKLSDPVAIRTYIASRRLNLDRLYLARFLPPRQSTEAEIKGGAFRITAEPAALTAVDSPYAKVGNVKVTEFNGSTFKLTASLKLNEKQQDAMHAAANAALLRAGRTGQQVDIQPIYENFISRLNEDGVQLSLDFGEEVYRAAALAFGKIQVLDTNTGNKVDISYGIPDAHRVTRVGNEAYDKPGSKFWEDTQSAREHLGVEPVMLTDPTSWNGVFGNPANAMISVGAPLRLATDTWQYTVTQAAMTRKANGDIDYNFGQQSNDYRKNIRVIVYGGRVDEPGSPYFWPTGQFTFIRETSRREELVDGQVVEGVLGYTHQGPNTEAGQEPTRHTEIYTLPGKRYEVHADGAEDIVPEIQEPRNLFIASSEIGK